MDHLQPEGWAPPRGYSNGIAVDGPGRMIFVAGQIAWDAKQQLVGGSNFVAQFRQALANVVAVVAAGGGQPSDLVRLTIYVTDKTAYLASLKAIGAVYRDLLGKHFPAMALVQVADLLEEGADVEIEATAFVAH
jgi:enamine deaminase RidA (YjgF/YER057c/UK114 family)